MRLARDTWQGPICNLQNWRYMLFRALTT
ncbi:hypothetical protein SCOCK_40232 [Actinacidiphila cocklensis]|uniref:Uncharacterized protein n=1 Tax=Actinacidiphila cocklensis TaxID=887465 RepID=A0A9W4DRG0_9ACTN|nr:hypothetical protein SCOCK_40232 [Actinacidiphila cocklensis]